VAEPARRVEAPPSVPTYDPTAVERAYVLYRARRDARVRRTRARRTARLRFFLVLAVLLALSVYIALAVWHEIQRMFGL
jgi:hypothetical protein